MRKTVIALLLICFVISFAGCGMPVNGPEQSEGETVQPTAEPTETATLAPTPEPTPTPTPVQKLPGTTGNYLILCETESQKQCVAEFAAYKEQNGYTVTVKSVEKDVKPSADTDTSLVMQQYLKDMDSDLSLEYVLLVGDPYKAANECPQHTGGIIPMRYMYWNQGNHNTRYFYDWYDYGNPDNNAFNTPTDMFYAIDFDWDYDKDGYAGETNEVAKAVKKSKPVMLFMLGRVPFSNEKDITAALNATMQYWQDAKEQSHALVAAGILSYPPDKKYPYSADGAFYGDALAKNLVKNSIDMTTMFEKNGAMPSKFVCTASLSEEGVASEIKNGCDFTYTFGHGGFYTYRWGLDSNGNGVCDEQLSEVIILKEDMEGHAGCLFMDGCHTMRVESESLGILHIQDLMNEGTAVAGIATTRETGFNPKKPQPRLASLMFTHGSLIISGEFYQSAIDMIKNRNPLEGYVYCYLGDPSIALRP